MYRFNLNAINSYLTHAIIRIYIHYTRNFIKKKFNLNTYKHFTSENTNEQERLGSTIEGIQMQSLKKIVNLRTRTAYSWTPEEKNGEEAIRRTVKKNFRTIGERLEEWKTALVCPTREETDKRDCNNCRGKQAC